MSEMRIDKFWCAECGQSLEVCDGEGVCTEARKRSIIGLFWITREEKKCFDCVSVSYKTTIDCEHPEKNFPIEITYFYV